YGFVTTLESTNPEIYNHLFDGTLPADDPTLGTMTQMQVSVSFGMSVFPTLVTTINMLIMIWFTNLYVKLLEWMIPSRHREEEEFTLKFISRGLLGVSELNIAQAEKELEVFAERVGRMVGMAQTLVHTKPGNDDFNQLYSRLEKYEEISDRMELEIGNFLKHVAEGRLSNTSKRHVAGMLAIVTEIESIADCCLGIGKILLRKQQANVHFNEEIYANIDSMFTYVDKAMANMVKLLSTVETPRESDIVVSYNTERELNNRRNQLRTQNITNINENHYEYQAAIFYMDIVSCLEKTGDYIINVVDAVRTDFRNDK
ncbi:MAG: Na/Pi cotransporter family protein, partial [Muribaculaceae bacterium]|nr:Na/Pi cotransporter family protein [Muribaculaceae bacterium]